jgi:hypothetical protein
VAGCHLTADFRPFTAPHAPTPTQVVLVTLGHVFPRAVGTTALTVIVGECCSGAKRGCAAPMGRHEGGCTTSSHTRSPSALQMTPGHPPPPPAPPTSVVSGAAWLVATLIMLPRLHHVMNRATAALAAAFLWVGACLAAAQGLAGYDAAVTVYLGLLPALWCGSTLADARANSLFRAPVTRIATPFGVELKASR